MKTNLIKKLIPLGLHFETKDPFLFCAHHKDFYPEGNDEMGPVSGLTGRSLGNDFSVKEGFRMYHGDVVPGFPEHPHRGFETVTIVRQGFVDHSDSFGAAGRYGSGDVQWMTAGSGMQHAEMFPLLNSTSVNTCELFQIWLNLPASRKMVNPHYKMLWREDVPVVSVKDEDGRLTSLTLIAGTYLGTHAVAPAPDSWAADAANKVDIHLIEMAPGAQWTLPAATAGLTRLLFYYEGERLEIDHYNVTAEHEIVVDADVEVPIKNGASLSRLLLLQGRPIGENVAQYGPFVMNTQEEIRQTIDEYHQTRFGGWPWERTDPVHDRNSGRFARFIDGSSQFPDGSV